MANGRPSEPEQMAVGHLRRRSFDPMQRIPFGQFSIPRTFVEIDTPLGATLLLVVNYILHFIFTFVQFNLFGPASCTGDILVFVNRYCFCGHRGPWELIITTYRLRFYIDIRNMAFLRFKFHYQTIDFQMYDYHHLCLSFDYSGYYIKCSYLHHLTGSDVEHNLHLVHRLQH